VLPALLDGWWSCILHQTHPQCGRVAPLGLAMGMPFPSGLRALAPPAKRRQLQLHRMGWAMNAASSVLGSVMAIVIAIQFG